MTNLRVSQAPLEVLYSSDSSIRVTQSVLQVLYKTEVNVFAPTSDISVGNWTPTPIFQQIDADDANCVVSETSPSNDQFEVGLAEVDGYDSGQTFQLRTIYAKVDPFSGNSPADDGDTIDITIEVREGNSTLETFTINDIQGNEPVNVLEVSAAGKGSIQNPANLSVRVTANASTVIGGLDGRACEVCFLVSETTGASELAEESNSPLLSIDGTGVNNGGESCINYPSILGEKGVGWESVASIFPNSGDPTTYGNILGNRLRSFRYYGGDNG
jgi:hypothetical protein